LELASDFSSESSFTLGAAYTRNALNSLGGELRVIVSLGQTDELSFDFYQPIDTRANWFVEPRAFWRRQQYKLWLEDVNIAEYQVSSAGLGFGMGRNFSTTDRASLSYVFSRGDADLVTGDVIPIDDKVKIGELDLSYLHDSRNNAWFPTAGMLHHLNYRYATDGLGSSFNFQQAVANGSMAFSRKKNTILLNYQAGYSFDNRAPVERWFQLGGLGRLSGLVPNQLTGQQSALATLAYYRRLNQMELIRTFAGFTLEAGNVWDFSQDIGFNDLRYSSSIFFGADTPIGPVYVAYGYSFEDGGAVYFYVGNPFSVNLFD
jgi:NTE family protein